MTVPRLVSDKSLLTSIFHETNKSRSIVSITKNNNERCTAVEVWIVLSETKERAVMVTKHAHNNWRVIILPSIQFTPPPLHIQISFVLDKNKYHEHEKYSF